MMDNPRLEAVQSLVHSLKTQYPRKGYYLSPSVKFTCDPQKGLSVVATQKIPKNENIIVIPHAECFLAVPVLKKLKPEIVPLLKKLEKNIEKNEDVIHHSRPEVTRSFLHLEDYPLILAIMRVLSLKAEIDGGNDDKSKTDGRARSSSRDDAERLLLQAATWPTEEDMKHTSWMYWNEDIVKRIWKQSGLSLFFDQFRSNPQSHFENVIYPLLKKYADDFIDTSLPSNSDFDCKGKDKKEALWNTFVYAMSLAWSRSHKAGDDNPELIPLVELFNGHSDQIDQGVKRAKSNEKTIINVEINRGKWPFIGGGVYRDECNLPCSAVHANRDIDQGEELIISYGDQSPLEFLTKYGALPEDFLSHHTIISHVCLWIDPKFVPTEQMRIDCLEKSGYPLDLLKDDKNCSLSDLKYENFIEYSKFNSEPHGVMSLRQFLILAMLADDYELNRNFTTGRLRGPMYHSRVLPLMCQTVDYNIRLLGEETSADDVERASMSETTDLEKTCLLARVVYRESLIMWRWIFARNAVELGGGEYLESLGSGCNVCGRSYPALRCGRCKNSGESVWYCSRGHQIMDWKHHKHQCGK